MGKFDKAKKTPSQKAQKKAVEEMQKAEAAEAAARRAGVTDKREAAMLLSAKLQ